MSTALANVSTGVLDRYGSPQELESFMQRAASIFQIPPEDLERPAVQASLVKATQNCLRFGYLPGIHVHMIPFNANVEKPHPQNPNATIKVKERVYAPDMGEKAWKDSADRIAQQQGFRYVVQTKAMTADEVKAATSLIPGQNYHQNDAGCKARVLRSDHAELYKLVGEKYDPEWVMGFWRQKKDQWGNSDTIPNGRTPADVAMRRATKAALMAVFHLVPLDEYEESMRFKRLNAYVEEETAIAPSLPAETLHTSARWETDEDGETWAVERPRLMAEEREKMGSEPTPAINSLDDVEELPFDNPHDTPEPPTNGNGNGNGAKAQLPAKLRKQLHAVGTQAYGDEWDEKRPELVKAITKERTETSNELTEDEANRLIAGMNKRINQLAAEAQAEAVPA